LPIARTAIEENPCLSEKKIAQTLSLRHDVVKRLMMEKLNLRRVNIKWVTHTLTASQKLEKGKISRKRFGQLNRLRANSQKVSLRGNNCHSLKMPCFDPLGCPEARPFCRQPGASIGMVIPDMLTSEIRMQASPT
jgi:hypothetical protein